MKVSFGYDGIDQNALRVPHLVTNRSGKALHFGGESIKMKMEIMKEHYGNDSIYIQMPWIIKDANMICTVLTMQMLMLRQDPARAHKDHVICQCDGGSENWNKTVIALAAFWVYMGVCRIMDLNRLFPRHGHEDFDQKGSVVTNNLNGGDGQEKNRGKNALTVSDMEKAVKAACDTEHARAETGPTKFPAFKHSLDFEAFFAPHFHDDLLGTVYGNIRRTIEEIMAGVPRRASLKCCRVYKDERGEVRIRWKYHQQDAEFVNVTASGHYSPDAPGTRVFETVPQLDEYPGLAPILEPDDWDCSEMQKNIFAKMDRDEMSHFFTDAQRTGESGCNADKSMLVYWHRQHCCSKFCCCMVQSGGSSSRMCQRWWRTSPKRSSGVSPGQPSSPKQEPTHSKSCQPSPRPQRQAMSLCPSMRSTPRECKMAKRRSAHMIWRQWQNRGMARRCH